MVVWGNILVFQKAGTSRGIQNLPGFLDHFVRLAGKGLKNVEKFFIMLQSLENKQTI